MSMALHMLGGRRGKSIGSVLVIALAALTVAAAPASAHDVSAAVPDCTAVHVTYVSTSGTTFSGTVSFDNGTVAATWNHVAGVDIPASGTIDVPYTAPVGPFAVSAQWHFSTGESGVVSSASMTCSTPPPATPPTVAAAPVPPPQPSSNVAGVVTSAPARVARVAVASECATRTAQVTVTGRHMRDVTLFVNRHRVRTIRVSRGTTRVRVNVPIARDKAQTVSARVRFRNGAAPRTLVHRAVRCAAAAVQPQFTG